MNDISFFHNFYKRCDYKFNRFHEYLNKMQNIKLKILYWSIDDNEYLRDSDNFWPFRLIKFAHNFLFF